MLEVSGSIFTSDISKPVVKSQPNGPSSIASWLLAKVFQICINLIVCGTYKTKVEFKTFLIKRIFMLEFNFTKNILVLYYYIYLEYFSIIIFLISSHYNEFHEDWQIVMSYE